MIKKISVLIIRYLKMLDNSFEPALSSYVNIDLYANKLIKHAHIEILMYKNNFVGLFAIYVNNYKDKIAYLSSLAIMHAYKGKDFAKILMDRCTFIAKEHTMLGIKAGGKKGLPEGNNFLYKSRV